MGSVVFIYEGLVGCLLSDMFHRSGLCFMWELIGVTSCNNNETAIFVMLLKVQKAMAL